MTRVDPSKRPKKPNNIDDHKTSQAEGKVLQPKEKNVFPLSGSPTTDKEHVAAGLPKGAPIERLISVELDEYVNFFSPNASTSTAVQSKGKSWWQQAKDWSGMTSAVSFAGANLGKLGIGAWQSYQSGDFGDLSKVSSELAYYMGAMGTVTDFISSLESLKNTPDLTEIKAVVGEFGDAMAVLNHAIDEYASLPESAPVGDKEKAKQNLDVARGKFKKVCPRYLVAQDKLQKVSEKLGFAYGGMVVSASWMTSLATGVLGKVTDQVPDTVTQVGSYAVSTALLLGTTIKGYKYYNQVQELIQSQETQAQAMGEKEKLAEDVELKAVAKLIAKTQKVGEKQVGMAFSTVSLMASLSALSNWAANTGIGETVVEAVGASTAGVGSVAVPLFWGLSGTAIVSSLGMGVYKYFQNQAANASQQAWLDVLRDSARGGDGPKSPAYEKAKTELLNKEKYKDLNADGIDQRLQLKAVSRLVQSSPEFAAHVLFTRLIMEPEEPSPTADFLQKFGLNDTDLSVLRASDEGNPADAIALIRLRLNI